MDALLNVSATKHRRLTALMIGLDDGKESFIN
jgi:hypothetical protein